MQDLCASPCITKSVVGGVRDAELCAERRKALRKAQLVCKVESAQRDPVARVGVADAAKLLIRKSAVELGIVRCYDAPVHAARDFAADQGERGRSREPGGFDPVYVGDAGLYARPGITRVDHSSSTAPQLSVTTIPIFRIRSLAGSKPVVSTSRKANSDAIPTDPGARWTTVSARVFNLSRNPTAAPSVVAVTQSTGWSSPAPSEPGGPGRKRVVPFLSAASHEHETLEADRDPHGFPAPDLPPIHELHGVGKGAHNAGKG